MLKWCKIFFKYFLCDSQILMLYLSRWIWVTRILFVGPISFILNILVNYAFNSYIGFLLEIVTNMSSTYNNKIIKLSAKKLLYYIHWFELSMLYPRLNMKESNLLYQHPDVCFKPYRDLVNLQTKLSFLFSSKPSSNFLLQTLYGET